MFFSTHHDFLSYTPKISDFRVHGQFPKIFRYRTVLFSEGPSATAVPVFISGGHGTHRSGSCAVRPGAVRIPRLCGTVRLPSRSITARSNAVRTLSEAAHMAPKRAPKRKRDKKPPAAGEGAVFNEQTGEMWVVQCNGTAKSCTRRSVACLNMCLCRAVQFVPYPNRRPHDYPMRYMQTRKLTLLLFVQER